MSTIASGGPPALIIAHACLPKRMAITYVGKLGTELGGGITPEIFLMGASKTLMMEDRGVAGHRHECALRRWRPERMRISRWDLPGGRRQRRPGASLQDRKCSSYRRGNRASGLISPGANLTDAIKELGEKCSPDESHSATAINAGPSDTPRSFDLPPGHCSPRTLAVDDAVRSGMLQVPPH